MTSQSESEAFIAEANQSVAALASKAHEILVRGGLQQLRGNVGCVSEVPIHVLPYLRRDRGERRDIVADDLSADYGLAWPREPIERLVAHGANVWGIPLYEPLPRQRGGVPSNVVEKAAEVRDVLTPVDLPPDADGDHDAVKLSDEIHHVIGSRDRGVSVHDRGEFIP